MIFAAVVLATCIIYAWLSNKKTFVRTVSRTTCIENAISVTDQLLRGINAMTAGRFGTDGRN